MEEAISIFEKAEELSYPVYLGQLYTQMATAYQEAGEYEKSVGAYIQAMEYSPNDRNILFHIATIYDDELNKPKKALEYYQRYLNHASATIAENERYAEQRARNTSMGRIRSFAVVVTIKEIAQPC
ncbi:MAG: hypothetical protein MAGBODY4_01277 [Candidatus Marinimicrobia bacterium]|nr:hypothetical protein [Candidatus Neomarinimicrobiota bacterium]